MIPIYKISIRGTGCEVVYSSSFYQCSYRKASAYVGRLNLLERTFTNKKEPVHLQHADGRSWGLPTVGIES
jgi:hypothetical protein